MKKQLVSLFKIAKSYKENRSDQDGAEKNSTRNSLVGRRMGVRQGIQYGIISIEEIQAIVESKSSK
ncbi:MAG TPA: hypothetical protein VII99_14885 [Bacteroidia bacterium]